MSSPHLRSGDLCFSSLRVEYQHKLFGILLQGRFVCSPPFIYLVIQSFIYITTDSIDPYLILWVIIQYYLIYLIYLLFESSPKNMYFLLVLERGEGKQRERRKEREREREKIINVRDKHQPVASCPCPNRASHPQPTHVP